MRGQITETHFEINKYQELIGELRQDVKENIGQ